MLSAQKSARKDTKSRPTGGTPSGGKQTKWGGGGEKLRGGFTILKEQKAREKISKKKKKKKKKKERVDSIQKKKRKRRDETWRERQSAKCRPWEHSILHRVQKRKVLRGGAYSKVGEGGGSGDKYPVKARSRDL